MYIVAEFNKHFIFLTYLNNFYNMQYSGSQKKLVLHYFLWLRSQWNQQGFLIKQRMTHNITKA